MPDRVLIPLGSLGVLELPLDVFERARENPNQGRRPCLTRC